MQRRSRVRPRDEHWPSSKRTQQRARLEMSRANFWGGTAVRSLMQFAASLTLIVGAVASGAAQTNAELQTYFKDSVGLTPDQISSIRSGQPVAKTLNSRTPAEIFVFGAVYIKGQPESYV